MQKRMEASHWETGYGHKVELKMAKQVIRAIRKLGL